MPDYIPQKDSELVPWSANFTGQVVANAAAWAIPSGEKFHHRGGKERRPRHPCEYHPHAGGIPFEEPRHHRRATQNRNGTMLGCEYSSGIQINAGLHLGLKDPLDARKNDATVCGLNRILSGEAWKTGNYHRGAVGNDMPVKFYIEAGHRALAEESEIKNRIDNTFFFDLQLLYGNLFSEENEKPYDAFLVDASLNFFSKQPVVGSVNVVGQLWGKNIPLKREKSTLHWGIFQHFDYYDSNTVLERQQVNSYRIAEAAALGVGGQYRRTSKQSAQFFLSAYLNGILLGGTITDYYRILNRDYNLGSGFSSKLYAGLLFKTNVGLYIKFEDYRLFTWKGYSPDMNLSQLNDYETLNLNIQGDKGKTKLTVWTLNFNYYLKKRCVLSLETSCYSRSSFYKYFPKVKYQIVESKIGIGYLL